MCCVTDVLRMSKLHIPAAAINKVCASTQLRALTEVRTPSSCISELLSEICNMCTEQCGPSYCMRTLWESHRTATVWVLCAVLLASDTMLHLVRCCHICVCSAERQALTMIATQSLGCPVHVHVVRCLWSWCAPSLRCCVVRDFGSC